MKKIKSLILLLASVFLITTAYGSVRKNKLPINTQTQIAPVDINPSNTIFVFDLHGPVLELVPQKAWEPFCKLKNKTNFFGKLLKYFFKNSKSKKSIEGIMLADQTDADNANNLAIINPHVPVAGTAEILKKLKNLGYQVYGCSNIGEQSYQYISAKFPEIFNNFTACYTSTAANNHLTKNSPLFFKDAVKFLEQHTGFQPVNIIFIDDTPANLKLAREADKRFYNIYFKNPKQLRLSLQNLGVTV